MKKAVKLFGVLLFLCLWIDAIRWFDGSVRQSFMISGQANPGYEGPFGGGGGGGW